MISSQTCWPLDQRGGHFKILSIIIIIIIIIITVRQIFIEYWNLGKGREILTKFIQLAI